MQELHICGKERVGGRQTEARRQREGGREEGKETERVGSKQRDVCSHPKPGCDCVGSSFAHSRTMYLLYFQAKASVRLCGLISGTQSHTVFCVV